MLYLLAITRDLMSASRLRATVQNLPPENGENWHGLFARTEADFRRYLEQESIAVALVDLQLEYDWRALIEAASAANVPVLAFGSHVKPEPLRQARAAGAYKAVANSAIAARLPELLAKRQINPPPLTTTDDYEIEE